MGNAGHFSLWLPQPDARYHYGQLHRAFFYAAAKQGKSEIQPLQFEYDSIGKEQAKTATELAYAEITSYNKKNLERELQNGSRQQNRQ